MFKDILKFQEVSSLSPSLTATSTDGRCLDSPTMSCNSKLSCPGTTAKTYDGTRPTEWAFVGNVLFDSFYSGNFDEDIDAIVESVGDDSGYFSNDIDALDATNSDVTTNASSHRSPDSGHSMSRLHADNFYADMPASNKSNHGSSNNDRLNQSTTHLERRPSATQNANRLSKTLYHLVQEHEQKTPHKFSSVASTGSRSFALEHWESTNQRHEWIAYQLDKPASIRISKRRRVGRQS